jgi:hypothetical protein
LAPEGGPIVGMEGMPGRTAENAGCDRSWEHTSTNMSSGAMSFPLVDDASLTDISLGGSANDDLLAPRPHINYSMESCRVEWLLERVIMTKQE